MFNKEAIIQRLKDDGFRITRARLAIIRLLADATQPLYASVIRNALKDGGLSLNRATIYRELNFLLAHDIIRRTHLAGKATRYEIDSGHRHHLVCIKCNTVTMITMGKHLERHERVIFQKENFKVISHALEFYGVCRNCQA
jgi:Fur family transcriptional regulator, ferric uptake regulator